MNNEQYASARLVYDPRLLRADDELRGFVKDHAANHPTLTLEVRDKPCAVACTIGYELCEEVSQICR